MMDKEQLVEIAEMPPIERLELCSEISGAYVQMDFHFQNTETSNAAIVRARIGPEEAGRLLASLSAMNKRYGFPSPSEQGPPQTVQ